MRTRRPFLSKNRARFFGLELAEKLGFSGGWARRPA
jgi:hypothetical protein